MCSRGRQARACSSTIGSPARRRSPFQTCQRAPPTVRIEMDGYQPWITTVRVNAGDQTRVAASFERQ